MLEFRHSKVQDRRSHICPLPQVLFCSCQTSGRWCVPHNSVELQVLEDVSCILESALQNCSTACQATYALWCVWLLHFGECQCLLQRTAGLPQRSHAKTIVFSECKGEQAVIFRNTKVFLSGSDFFMSIFGWFWSSCHNFKSWLLFTSVSSRCFFLYVKNLAVTNVYFWWAAFYVTTLIFRSTSQF